MIGYRTVPIGNSILYWDQIRDPIIECIEKGGLGIHTPELVYRNLMSGEWSLWIAEDSNCKVCSFMIVSIKPEQWAEIVYGYIKPSISKASSKNIKVAMLYRIERAATLLGCKKILAYSSREGMEKLLEPFNYQSKMTIYCKNLAKSND